MLVVKRDGKKEAVAFDKIIYAMQWDAALDKIVAMASNYDASKQAWNTNNCHSQHTHQTS
jgi:hypothetical protein